MVIRDPLVNDDRANAVVGWTLLAALLAVAGRSALVGQLLWSALALVVAGAVAAPAVVTRSTTTIVPWPLVFLATVAVTVRSFGYALEVAGYVAVATFALVVVVELDVFSEVDMSRRFAVGFAVLVTLATEALWTVAQFYSDRWFDTAFLQSQTELQWDFVAVTTVALVMGLFFAWYFQRIGYGGSQELPGEAASA
ncbi:hypothetical protein ACAH01_16100 (plasmid) [Halomicrobium sp. HM KBTZ05]|uniref:hypothetical protein n=1 Tax=Halomicrobium sp. HM KBTZ05 TaxID=3242663 RepID=UPI0035585487